MILAMTGLIWAEEPDGVDGAPSDDIMFNGIDGLHLRISRRQVTLAAFVVFTLGCALDHLTTAYGLNLYTVAEANPLVVQLMKYGVWHSFEVAVITAGILQILVAYSIRSKFIYGLSSCAMMFAGFARYYVALHNITVIMSALS